MAHRSLATLVLAIFLTFTAMQARAACSGPSAAEGDVMYSQPYHTYQFCDGTLWKSFADLDPTAGGPGCSSPSGAEGVMIYNGDYHAVQFCNGTNWVAVGQSGGGAGCSSCSVSSYSFPPIAPQPASTLVESGIVQISTSSCSASVSITGSGSPEFRICTDSACSTVINGWGLSSQTVSNGQYVQARLTTSASNGTDTATVTVGSTVGTFSVDTAATYKAVFITSTLYSGNLGGLAGADAKCASAATAAGLAGTYLAWIADNTDASGPATRFTQASIPYRAVGLTKIADNWTGLVGGTLLTDLNKDEYGNPSSISSGNYSGQKPFHSNVNADGTRVGASNCTGWTVTTGNGQAGDAKQSGATWSNATSQSCTTFALMHILCVQQ